MRKRSNWVVHFETHQQTIVDALVNQAKSSAVLRGIVFGFILNTLMAGALAFIYIEINRSDIIDRAVENRLGEISEELAYMEDEFAPEPPTAQEVSNGANSR